MAEKKERMAWIWDPGESPARARELCFTTVKYLKAKGHGDGTLVNACGVRFYFSRASAERWRGKLPEVKRG